nr:unnamed protein product [Callosobruchus analis]
MRAAPLPRASSAIRDGQLISSLATTMVRAPPALRAALAAALAALCIAQARGESLTPPYFNLAEGKRITASATCGEGLQGPEMYCKLIGTNGDNDLTENVIQGQYFYAIKDISIGGRCMCNGHAEACDIPDPRDNKILLCHCQHNTCGAKCDKCCPGYEQKAWRHYECEYDPEIDRKHLSLDIHGKYEGGGVCKNCQHNTEGINCNKCKPTFYRPYQKHWNETDVCQPCNCNTYYSTGNCAEGSGRCECKPAYTPPYCDSCSFGYYGYPDCRPCECYLNGTMNQQCTAQEGLCQCLPNFGGDYCKECAPGYFNFSQCSRCECDPQGSVSQVCDQTTGACTCKNKYAGLKCDQCSDGYFYSGGECTYCNCDRSGTEDGICDKQTGQCICKPGYGGERCDMCILSYYGHPDCKPCNCSKVGSHGTTCSASGKCSCLSNYAGRTCEQCSPGYYNYPECKHCNCHPAGVVAGFAGCGSVPAGELCQCKERVEGRICDRCKPLYWNLNLNNPHGCEECQCDLRGTLGGLATCDTEQGQCTCKPSVVARRCSECVDGTYGLMESDLFGCTDCGCDVGGSLSNICNKQSGQCQCQSRVTGRTCKEPLQAHYFPTLFHYQYEAEKGRTPENNRVRLSYDETVFPNFSWKGYVTFYVLQKEIIQDIYIDKPSLYRMVLRFVNRNPHTVIGGVRIIPDNPNDIEQYHKVQLRNTSKPAFVTLSGESGNTPKPFVMNPGRWSVSITASENILLDYFVLLPEDFYLATILNQKVEKPCKVDELDLCRHYAYPTVTSYSRAWGVGGFIQGPNNDQIQLKQWFPSQEHLQKIQAYNRVPLLNSLQPEIAFNITVPKPGPYVLVVNYVTPLDDLRTHNITVTTQTRNGEEIGQVKFYACPYTTMCRQVVADTLNGVAVYTVDGNNILLTMNGINTNVGVHSVYAIPYDEWSMDQIMPKPVCVRKNGTCIPSTFHNPPETKKIQFEDEVEGELAKNRPPLFVDNETTYVWLNATDNTVDLKGKVPSPGYYTFILHYRQPHYPVFDLNVLIHNGQFYEAKVPVEHCPSESGCRAVVTEVNRNEKFSLTENFIVTVKQPDNKSVFLDYLLVVPADLYDARSLEEEDLDRTGEDAIFSITTNHKNGALPCECDFAGSDSFVCETFGGQCKCKENIIGRRCEACKTGYYGFPECKPCNCPSTAYCEPNTGECICPPHVVGEKCDQCEPLTYGFDPFNGCEECRCNPLGVANNTRQCNLLTGDCPCQENIFGRTCDHCKPGYYSFPYCASCECNEVGTTSEICDKPENEEGCTECFCFGKSKRCISSNYIKVSLNVSLNASEHLNVTHLNLTTEDIDDISDVIGVDFSYYNVSQAPAYFAAPSDYLGKKLTSYGGFLNYTIYYVIGQGGSAVGGPDVILQASEFAFMLQLVEGNFELPSGSPAKREHMMEVLKDLRGIYLRATYWTASVTTRLIDVLEDEAIPPDPGYENGVAALSVEQCMCPPNYQGLSCEECAPGYYRVPGPHGGYCIPCECHGHATECDVNTGICMNCMHNTKGDHCEFCDVGYHGNAKAGTPRDCLICACPLPIASNNFAVGCQVSADGEKISCDCKEGYIGARCQSCGAGFYGKPETQDDFCRPCQCSGNIDPRDPSSCDTVTGECLRCLNNTAGTACSLCKPGFFGDAVHLKDCQACICDKTGTDHCDSFTGRCVCRPNVVGEKCDRCEPYHYGFQSGRGCVECSCSSASESDQCEDATGQCKCKPGAAGRACDRCAAGYWNYTSEGCQSCGCKSEYSLGFGCNAQTGQCECLQGVVGEKCDQCPHRWAFVPEVGCHACDSCHHALLNDTDQLAAMIDPIIFEFDLDNLTSELKDVDPKQVSLDETIQELESLEQDTKNLNRKSNYSLENSEQLKNKSEGLKDTLEILLDDINTVEDIATMTIDDINTITMQLTKETGKEIDNALQEGQEYLNQIKGYDLTGRQTDADRILERVEDVLRNVTEYKLPVEELQEKVDEIKGNLLDIDEKLDDLFNHSQYSLNMAREAENIIAKSGKDRLKGKLGNIENQVRQSGINLDESEQLLSNASKLLDISIGKLKELQDAPEILDGMNNKFEEQLKSNRKKIDEIQVLKPKVQEHAQSLSDRVQQLEHILSESQQTEKQLNTVNETLPSVIQSLEDIPKKQAENKRTSNNIQSNINKLNQQIELARDIANRIKVGVEFYPNTTLELRTPKNIEDLTTATKFSGYFKTSKPNGLLFYIGNPQGTTLPKTKTDDFMALIIQNGYPVLKMDLGNGVQKIINEKYVADDNWYQYIVERLVCAIKYSSSKTY